MLFVTRERAEKCFFMHKMTTVIVKILCSYGSRLIAKNNIALAVRHFELGFHQPFVFFNNSFTMHTLYKEFTLCSLNLSPFLTKTKGLEVRVEGYVSRKKVTKHKDLLHIMHLLRQSVEKEEVLMVNDYFLFERSDFIPQRY